MSWGARFSSNFLCIFVKTNRHVNRNLGILCIFNTNFPTPRINSYKITFKKKEKNQVEFWQNVDRESQQRHAYVMEIHQKKNGIFSIELNRINFYSHEQHHIIHIFMSLIYNNISWFLNSLPISSLSSHDLCTSIYFWFIYRINGKTFTVQLC